MAKVARVLWFCVFCICLGLQRSKSARSRTRLNDDASSTSQTKPNIVFIMTDDLGWGNVGYHNKLNADEIKTPVIDQLVAEGLELDRHYTFAGCSPSRASFQSGRLPVHLSTKNTDGLLDPTHGMPSEMTGFATKLKEGNYNTHMVGKWDVGFATWDKLPVSNGYDSFYGYLGKGVEYWSKQGDPMCNVVDYIDFWEDDHPVVDSMDNLDRDTYVEFMFKDRVNEIINSYGTSADNNADDIDDDSDPFLLFYSMHLPHYPSQVPEEYLESFENDVNYCKETGAEVYPGYKAGENRDEFKCRSIVQSQVNLMDSIVGDIVDNLKANDLWDNTLLIFSSDNGGSLELDHGGSNNWPLRGGKSSMWEGGVRSVAFVSGGYLPESRRGQKEEGLMHLADWYPTFCTFAGVDPADSVAVEAGLPDVDGVDLWPLISGQVDESPRSDIIVGPNAYISGRYKIHIHDVRYAVLQEPQWPNPTTPTQSELKKTIVECDWESPCLFDIFEDPSESKNIATDYPEIVESMTTEFKKLSEDFYSNTEQGMDSCPAALDTEELACGCWTALNNYNYFVGPYQDLTEEHRHWNPKSEVISDPLYYWHLQNPDRETPPDFVEPVMNWEQEKESTPQEKVLSDTKLFYDVQYLGLELKHYILIVVASVMGCILIAVFVKYFKEIQEQISMMKSEEAVSVEYGTV